jgi:hypothetical protein
LRSLCEKEKKLWILFKLPKIMLKIENTPEPDILSCEASQDQNIFTTNLAI